MSWDRPTRIDVWTIHAYGAQYQTSPMNNVMTTWNKMVSKGVPKLIWVTEANMSSDTSAYTQRTRANYWCKVSKTQPWDQTFFFAANGDPGGALPTWPNPWSWALNNPDGYSYNGLWGSETYNFTPKWLLEAFGGIPVNQYLC